jgi:uncharacterized membrane protein YfcA
VLSLTPLQDLLTVLSGILVGFALGLVGGGGSVLAVPLLVYVVGIPSPHVAIGTSAIAVAANAAFNLVRHFRARTVKLRCAFVFAAFGVAGAALGSTFGKAVDGGRLLALFGVVMIVIGLSMVRRQSRAGNPNVELTRETASTLLPRLAAGGLVTGMLAGFFGIGGGFLVGPALMVATGMPLINAIGSSLVSVAAFGLTTAANYARSGLIDWPVAGLLLLGGVGGGIVGVLAAHRLAAHRNALSLMFSAIIVTAGLYVLWRGAGNLFAPAAAAH